MRRERRSALRCDAERALQAHCRLERLIHFMESGEPRELGELSDERGCVNDICAGAHPEHSG
jgi:hypothetical protein